MSDPSIDEIVVTNEMRRAVRRDECRWVGHSFAETVSFGNGHPLTVYCTRCGERWDVVQR